MVLAVATLAVSSILCTLMGYSMQFWPPEAQAAFLEETWDPSAEALGAEIAAYRGG